MTFSHLVLCEEVRKWHVLWNVNDKRVWVMRKYNLHRICNEWYRYVFVNCGISNITRYVDYLPLPFSVVCKVKNNKRMSSFASIFKHVLSIDFTMIFQATFCEKYLDETFHLTYERGSLGKVLQNKKPEINQNRYTSDR